MLDVKVLVQVLVLLFDIQWRILTLYWKHMSTVANKRATVCNSTSTVITYLQY